MRTFTRGMVLVLTILGSALAAASAVAAWGVKEWGLGSPETMQLRLSLEGTPEARVLGAAVAAAVALLVVTLGVMAAFARRQGVTLWLGGQQPMQAPADVVERFLCSAVTEVKGVEAARVRVRSAGRGTTTLALELSVAPDADATVVAATIESRVGSMLTPPCSIVLGGRPSITIRYGMQPVRDGSSRQAA